MITSEQLVWVRARLASQRVRQLFPVWQMLSIQHIKEKNLPNMFVTLLSTNAWGKELNPSSMHILLLVSVHKWKGRVTISCTEDRTDD